MIRYPPATDWPAELDRHEAETFEDTMEPVSPLLSARLIAGGTLHPQPSRGWKRRAAWCWFWLLYLSIPLSAFLLGLVFWIVAWAAELSGPAYAIDGDTLVVAGTHVRLYGIDAPESTQTCGATACGREATAYLAYLLRFGRSVTCAGRESDRYGRTVATCSAGGRDLGEAMVRAGWALEYARYSDGRYSIFEAEARAAKRGIWATDFIPPRQWRREHNPQNQH